MNYVITIIKIFLLAFFYFLLGTNSQASELKKTIVVSCDDWANYCNKDGSGWYLDMLREIYSANDIQIKLKSEPFARGLESVKSGTADLILTGYNIPERQKEFVLSKVRIDNEQTVVAFMSPTTYTLGNLQHGRVAYVRGVAYQEHFAPTMKLIEVTRRTQAIEMLTNRRIDYFMADYSETIQAIEELHLDASNFSFERIAVKPLYVMFQKSAYGQTLADMYDAGIASIYKAGRPQALAKQYQIYDFSVYFPELGGLPLDDNQAGQMPK